MRAIDRQRAIAHRIAVEETCIDPGTEHEHCPLHGCVEYVCCIPTEGDEMHPAQELAVEEQAIATEKAAEQGETTETRGGC